MNEILQALLIIGILGGVFSILGLFAYGLEKRYG